MAIQFLRGTSSQRSTSDQTLLAGQPFYETDTEELLVSGEEVPIKDPSTRSFKATLREGYNTITVSVSLYTLASATTSWKSLTNSTTGDLKPSDLGKLRYGEIIHIVSTANSDDINNYMNIVYRHHSGNYYYFSGTYQNVPLTFRIYLTGDSYTVNYQLANANNYSPQFKDVVLKSIYNSGDLTIAGKLLDDQSSQRIGPLYKHTISISINSSSAPLYLETYYISTRSDNSYNTDDMARYFTTTSCCSGTVTTNSSSGFSTGSSAYPLVKIWYNSSSTTIYYLDAGSKYSSRLITTSSLTIKHISTTQIY